jgi:hypothetical protein
MFFLSRGVGPDDSLAFIDEVFSQPIGRPKTLLIMKAHPALFYLWIVGATLFNSQLEISTTTKNKIKKIKKY